MAVRSRYHQRDYAEEYDQDRFGGSFGDSLEAQEVELYLSLLGDWKGRLLDVGAGTGKLTVAILGRGRDVTSVDFSIEMLRVARQKATSKGLEGLFGVSDMQALGVRDRAFACTVSSRALMHVPRWRVALAELCRVTSQTLVIDFPPRFSAAGVDVLRHRLQRLLPGRTVHSYRTFLVGQVVGELEKNGFTVVERKRTFFLPVIFYRWLDRPGLARRLEGLFSALGLVRLFGAPVTIKAVRNSVP